MIPKYLGAYWTNVGTFEGLKYSVCSKRNNFEYSLGIGPNKKKFDLQRLLKNSATQLTNY
jgi:hypothetical protein